MSYELQMKVKMKLNNYSISFEDSSSNSNQVIYLFQVIEFKNFHMKINHQNMYE